MEYTSAHFFYTQSFYMAIKQIFQLWKKAETHLLFKLQINFFFKISNVMQG